VLNNLYPTGGFQTFVENGGDQSTIATWLQDAGYNTARIGKYLVGYPQDSTYIPPGWDEWYSTYDGTGRYFNYSLNENGTVVGGTLEMWCISAPGSGTPAYRSSMLLFDLATNSESGSYVQCAP
jgi:arylsulfatase A-like enzyme